LKKTHIAVYFH